MKSFGIASFLRIPVVLQRIKNPKQIPVLEELRILPFVFAGNWWWALRNRAPIRRPVEIDRGFFADITSRTRQLFRLAMFSVGAIGSVASSNRKRIS